MKKLLFIVSLGLTQVGLSQTPQIVWEQALGGSQLDNGRSIEQTSDGGYIVAGYSSSNDGNVSGNNGGNDFWVVKLNASGSIVWQKSLGGSQVDVANSVQQTSDGGYIIAGYSTSSDGDVSMNYGGQDVWVVKLDSFGNISWEKNYGGSTTDEARSIKQTSDGGYIFTGISASNDVDVSGNNGWYDVWVVKINSLGNLIWQKCLGGSVSDYGESVKQTSDGGYIVAGYTDSNDGDVIGNNGGRDCWVVKLDQFGNVSWQNALGGSSGDAANSIQQTMDGGYIFAGSTTSNNGDVTSNNGWSDIWLVKLDPAGSITWETSLGGSDLDSVGIVQQTTDGGYIVSGWTNSLDGDVSSNNGGNDIWVVKLDQLGNITWDKPLGGTSDEFYPSIKQTSDGGYVVVGITYSNDGDVTGNNGAADYWVVRLSVPNVFGSVYNDFNQNCVLEAMETGLGGFNLAVDPGNLILTSNSNGEWYLDSLPAGSYTVTIDTTNLNWIPTCPIYQSFTVVNSQLPTQAPDFGMINTNPCTSPDVSIYAPFLRRCWNDQVVYVQACNEITATGILTNSYVEVELDSLLTPTSSSIPYTSLGNNVYHFNIGDLYPGECVDFTINTTVSCDAIMGETLCMEAILYPIESCALDTVPTNPLPPNYGNNPNLVMPQPCTLPWDNSSLQVEGWCQGDSVYFSITNTGDFGNGDMDCYSPVFLHINDTLVSIDSVQLQGQQTVYYSYPANGETWILNAEQHPLHPGNSHPNAHVELCGSDSTGWIPNMVNNQPLDDADPINDIFCGVVMASYDPNDKTGYPIGSTDQNYIKPNQQLQYVIRFQNTGNDTAFVVVIRDTLDVDLNIFTVNSGVSSHAYTFQMYGPRVLEWTFDNILLPDSTTNEPESNGFVTFTVDQVSNLPEGSIITNEADIYFDFNPPIITNETIHRISYFTESAVLEVNETYTSVGNKVKVYPNPTNDVLFIEMEDGISNSQYVILDLHGRKVRSGRITEQKSSVDLNSLKLGVYLIQVGGSNPIRIIKQ